MAFFINENTQTPRLLMNGGSLKVGKGLEIDDDELISLGDVTRAEFELEISSIKNNVQLNTESILTLSSNLDGAIGNITTNSSKIETLTNNLGEIIGTVTTQGLSILDLNSRFDSAEATLSAHTSSISDLTNKTSVNSQSILDLQTNLEQATADIQTTHSEISGLQSSIDGKLDTSDFWTTLGYNSEEEFKQAISESGLTQEQLDALRELTDGKYLSTDSFLELISDADFASSEIGSKLLEITKNNVDDQTIINAVTSQAGLSTLATALGASSELTNKFATIQSVTDLANDLATETTNRTEAISSLQQSVNDKVSSAELQTSLGNYYDKSTVDGIVENAKTEARSGLLLESELEQAIADLNTYYTKTDVDNNISTATSGLLATSDLSSAIADLNAYYTKTEADSATTTAIGNFRTEANNTFAKTSDIAEFITEDEANGLISTATAGFVAQADYNTAQATMNSRIDGVEAGIATAVTKDSNGNIESDVTISADQIVLSGETWADIINFEELISEAWEPNDDYPTSGLTINNNLISVYTTDEGRTDVRAYTDIRPGSIILKNNDRNTSIEIKLEGIVVTEVPVSLENTNINGTLKLDEDSEVSVLDDNSEEQTGYTGTINGAKFIKGICVGLA